MLPLLIHYIPYTCNISLKFHVKSNISFIVYLLSIKQSGGFFLMNKFKSVTATLAAITLLLSATPISAATQSNSSAVIANTQASLNLDETALKRLTEAITALVGKQTVQFTSSSPGLGSDELSVEGIVKGAATAMSSQVYNKKKIV